MSRRQLAAVALLGLGVALARAAEVMPGRFDNLIKNSPFGQPVVTSAQAGGQPLEFRGTFVDGNERFFSLYDPATRASQWVGLNETGQPYLVENYDSAKGSIQVKYRNQVLTLTLKLAQILVQAMPPSVPNPAAPPQATAGNSPPADEATRLALVAEEIRRRRASRAQGSQPPQNAGNPPSPGPGLQQNLRPGNPPAPLPTRP